MMEVMDLIKCFYSTFIHYFLINLVIKYFYMFISEFVFTARLCIYVKRNISFSLFETEDDCWPKSTKLDLSPKCDQECLFLSVALLMEY